MGKTQPVKKECGCLERSMVAQYLSAFAGSAARLLASTGSAATSYRHGLAVLQTTQEVMLVPETQGSVAIGCVSPFCVNSCERKQGS